MLLTHRRSFLCKSNNLKAKRHVKNALHHLHEMSICKMRQKSSFLKELSEINSEPMLLSPHVGLGMVD